MGLRRSRYIGLRKTHLAHLAIAAAVNVIQLMSWLRGEAPEQTRTSAFQTGHGASGLRWIFDFATSIQSGHEPMSTCVFNGVCSICGQNCGQFCRLIISYNR